jgi:hypothetical protein
MVLFVWIWVSYLPLETPSSSSSDGLSPLAFSHPDLICWKDSLDRGSAHHKYKSNADIHDSSGIQTHYPVFEGAKTSHALHLTAYEIDPCIFMATNLI